MDLRCKIKQELTILYGDFDTYLEKKYVGVIIEKLYVDNVDKRFDYDTLKLIRAWTTYNQVIIEFKFNLENITRVKELQYRLTGDENPNTVCLEIIGRLSSLPPELHRLYHKIKNFN